jgi:hypothetical protein
MAAFTECDSNAVRSVKPEIGANEHVLNLADRFGIELALGEEVGNGAATNFGAESVAPRDATPKPEDLQADD